jgi:hypothetical protein
MKKTGIVETFQFQELRRYFVKYPLGYEGVANVEKESIQFFMSVSDPQTRCD